MLKAFVSFSHKDQDFVQRLFDRLRAQPLEVWDYSREGSEIPGGSDIRSFLQARVEKCEVFLPVVSPHSLNSAYTRHEVQCAFNEKLRRPITIIPLIIDDARLLSPWSGPYAQLEGVLGYSIATTMDAPQSRMNARTSLEEALRRLCDALGIDYCSPPVEDPRLPFMDKFDAELHRAGANARLFRHQERQNAVFQRLTDARNEACAALECGQYSEALRRINYFIATCEYEVSGHAFFFPVIVKGICLASCGQFSAALDVLLPLQAHPAADENLFGLLGYIKLQQGAFQEAAQFYQRCMAIDAADPAATHGYLLSAAQSGTLSAVSTDRLLDTINLPDIAHPEDKVKVLGMRAFVNASRGRFDAAIAAYEEMLRLAPHDAAAVINYADCLEHAGRPEQALSLLQQHRDTHERDPNYLHRLASLYFKAGNLAEARRCFDRLVARHPQNRQYHIDAARVLLELGDRDGAKALATSILDPTHFGIPGKPNDFFCTGFAQWMLGDEARARYDFERSGLPDDVYYANLISA